MSGLLPKAQTELRKATQVHPRPSTDSGLATQTSSGELAGGPVPRRLTQWTIISEKTGVQATKERLKSFWTTLGVVSALMAALTYPAVTTPMVTKHNTGSGSGGVNDPLFISYVLLNTSSLILSFMVVIISVVLLAEVDLVVTDDDLEVFIGRYQYLFLTLTGIFGVSILTIVASIIVINFFNYTKGTAIASAAICISGTLIVAAVSGWLAIWTRSRLKVHIDEANALLRAAIGRMRKMVATQVGQNRTGQAPGQGPQDVQKGTGAPSPFLGAAASETAEGNPRGVPVL
ncbi:hypothetical protein Vretimale_5281 [Volvox reticuliferus]|uniref:Uncharacterized protein n=1 Tax=Volvox reticuliferus TaxID=1737510 RepID=A0A8J4FIH6_9CHLO|nr:hypothetical protein Vretifemale_3628 [Volvox reticuliferus]GIM00472.1 hypothetical protein Vretimale_5281 [Volvox reticuliferus]